MLLGIDVGTTATKISLARFDGSVLGARARASRVASPRPGFAECDPTEWWDNICLLIPAVLEEAEVDPGRIRAVGVAGMVPTLICTDANGEPLRPSIQQNDARAHLEVAEMHREIDADAFLRRSGSALTIQSIGPTVRWLERHEPEIVSRTRRICGSYDWIVGRITGARVNEANWAIESGLVDHLDGDWDTELLEIAHVDPAWLTRPSRSHEIVGHVSSAAAEATGLAPGTPVSAGAADHIASAFSAGVVGVGDLLVKLGGAGDILASTDTPITDRRLYLDHHLVPGAWMPNGCMATSGAALEWFRRTMDPTSSFAELDAIAESLPPGSDGLLCQPHLLGEKSPIHDPLSRGVLTGLHLGHTRHHIYRSILEGIAFGVGSHVDVLTELGVGIERVRVTNGGSRSRLWRQIVADVIDRPLESLVDHPGSGLGAAFAAGVGIGDLEWSDIHHWTSVDEIIEPHPVSGPALRELAALHASLYAATATINHHLSRIQASDPPEG